MIDTYDEMRAELDEAVDYATATTGKAIIFTGTTMIAGTAFYELSDLKSLPDGLAADAADDLRRVWRLIPSRRSSRFCARSSLTSRKPKAVP